MMNVHDSISQELLDTIYKDAEKYIQKLANDFTGYVTNEDELSEILNITDQCANDYELISSPCSDVSCEECWSRALKMGKWKE